MFKVEKLKSFRILKFPQGDKDKGLAIIKVKSLDAKLCSLLPRIRDRYLVATAECYFNSPQDIRNIASFSSSFDFHLVSCDQVRSGIQKINKSAKCCVVGAGEYLTSPTVFGYDNPKKRKIDLITLANSVWRIKNLHHVLDLHYFLLSKGHKVSSRIVCTNVKDKGYHSELERYIDTKLKGQSQIIIGVGAKELRDLYNASKYMVHLSDFDSSPRVVFEALLCGCNCILRGKWSESLNTWLKCPQVKVITKFDDVLKFFPAVTEYDPSFANRIGLVNVWSRIFPVCREIYPEFKSEGVVYQTCIGKETLGDFDSKYSKEVEIINHMLGIKK